MVPDIVLLGLILVNFGPLKNFAKNITSYISELMQFIKIKKRIILVLKNLLEIVKCKCININT